MLFISYSRKDLKLATRLAKALDRTGHKYWIDQSRLKPGDSWNAAIETAMKQSTAVAAILTNASSLENSFVRHELFYARRVLNKPIYTLVPESILNEKIPMEVADLQQILCTDNFESGIEALLRNLVPLEQGGCVIQISRELVTLLLPDSIEYAMMSRFPQTRSLSVKEEIASGNSGSKVFFVDASFHNSDKPPSPHFLKINNAQNDQPRKRYELAYTSKLQGFMPALSDATPWDEQSKRIGLLYGLGDDARGGFVSLEDLLHKNLGQAAEVIRKVCTALLEWNDGGVHGKNLYAHELLEHALCHSLDPDSRSSRLDPQLESSVFFRSATLLGLTEGSPLIDFETRYGLPNPLVYLMKDSPLKEYKNLSITYPTGNTHGDLHVRNIQAIYKTRDKKSLAVSFIDFDTYRLTPKAIGIMLGVSVPVSEHKPIMTKEQFDKLKQKLFR